MACTLIGSVERSGFEMCVECKCLGIKVGYQNQIGVVAVLRTSQFSRQQQVLPHRLQCITSDVAISHGMCQDDVASAAMMSSWVYKRPALTLGFS